MTSHFAFLQAEWPAIHEAAAKAAAAVHPDPRTACFYARRALELAVDWAFKFDTVAGSALPGQPQRADPRAHLQGSRRRGGVQQGAGHHPARQPGRPQPAADPADDALRAVRELFHVGYWLAHTYARGHKPAPSSPSTPARCPRPRRSRSRQSSSYSGWKPTLRERDEKLSALLADKPPWMRN